MVNATLPLGPTLETERLILRPPAAADVEGHTRMMADEEAARFLGGAIPAPTAWRGWSGVVGHWVMRGYGMFSVIERSSGAWIGRIGPLCPEGWPGTEVGWGLAREAWGKGYATEAAQRAIDWAFDELGWSEVIHCIETANVNSAAVAKRLGSKILRRDHLPPPFGHIELDIWGQTREEWRARHPRKQPSVRAFTITAVDHVQVTVPPELERTAKHFYGELLGLCEIEKPEELKPRGGAWYGLDNAQFHLAIDAGASGVGSRRHVCFAVSDLEAARAAFKSQGLEMIDEPIQADGLMRFFLRDPAGNRVEIGQRLK